MTRNDPTTTLPSRRARCVGAIGLALTLGTALVTSLVACGDPALETRVGELERELGEKSAALEEALAAATTDTETDAEESETAEALEKARAKIASLKKELSKARGEGGALKTELQRKEEALAAIKALEDSLGATLVKEIEAGDISVKERDGYLVVNVSDQVLFATGSAELSARGERVIGRLAESLAALPDEPVFQVGGHTDNQPIKSDAVLERFPTNWELSTARATNVVRYLEETAEIPGKRLVAAGFGEFRPVASNRSAKSRKKNRRIEIALLPPRGE